MFGEEWKTFEDAFYTKPKKGTFRGSYWCWFLQGDDSSPKVWIMINHIAARHTLSGVESKIIDIGKKDFSVMISCWYYSLGKMHDMFIENGIMHLDENSFFAETEGGYILKSRNDSKNYFLTVDKNGKNILDCKGDLVNMKDAKIVKYKNSYNTTSFSDMKNKACLTISEDVRFPQLIKISNLFSHADVKFTNKRFSALSYAEKNQVIGTVTPWKYAIFDLKDGSRFRFYWNFRSIIKTPADIGISFEYGKTGEKYFFDNPRKICCYYMNKNKKITNNLENDTKFVVVKAYNDSGEIIETLSEITAKHVYYYKLLKFGLNIGMPYNQLILKLKKIKFRKNGKKINLDENGAFGYGEYVNF